MSVITGASPEVSRSALPCAALLMQECSLLPRENGQKLNRLSVPAQGDGCRFESCLTNFLELTLRGKVAKRHLLSGLWLGNFNRCFCPWTGKTEGKALFPEMRWEGYVERPTYCENCAKQVHAYPAELRAGFPSFCNLPEVN